MMILQDIGARDEPLARIGSWLGMVQPEAGITSRLAACWLECLIGRFAFDPNMI